MKRFILLCCLLAAFFYAFSNPVEYKQCIPASGSAISSFNFVLEFDITKALEAAATESPGVNVGLGYMGGASSNTTSGCATLYKGDQETGQIIGTSLTSVFNGKAEGFKVNGNTVAMNFDETIPVIPDQEYTIVITNIFMLYKENAVTRFNSTRADFHDNPIILKFSGKNSGETQLYVENSSVENESTLDKIDSIQLTLSSPFTINSDASVLVKEGDNTIYYTSNLSQSSTNEKILVATFDNVPLNLGHTYTIVLPANSLAHKDDPTVGNFEYVSDGVNGNTTYEIGLLSSKVDVDSNGIPTAVTFIYDIPEGTTLDSNKWTMGYTDGFLSIEGSDESTNFTDKCTIVEFGKGLKWDISSVTFEPATTYSFSKPGNTVIVADSNKKWLTEYVGEDATIQFTTPSVEDLHLAPITVGAVKVGDFSKSSSPEFENGGTYANIDYLDIQRLYYDANGTSYFTTVSDDPNIFIYDVTDGTRKEVKTVKMNNARREGNYEYYNVLTLPLNISFLQDHTYEIVIPKGAIRLSGLNNPLYDYVTNDEIVYTVKGATPAEFAVEACSIENNAEMSTVPAAIVWTLNGAYELKSSDETVKAQFSGSMVGNLYPPISIKKDGYLTYVAVHLTNSITGEVYKLMKDANFTVTIPAGTIVYPGEESLSNPELVVTIIGKDEEPNKPIVIEPEFVNVNLAVNGIHTTAHQTAKGKSYALTITPEDNWKVESVMHGDKELSLEGDSYVTEPLDKDADITATLAYDGPWAVEVSTGVWEITEDNITIARDGQLIVVSGVTPEQTINVYTVGGLLVGTANATPDNEIVKLTVAPGQVYIVTVNGKAAKIQM
ncbi:MAG: hypothetical protein HDR95_07320 [Bacteroides sp.]|nr:hypothetical protein [Bacteroides sp.]